MIPNPTSARLFIHLTSLVRLTVCVMILQLAGVAGAQQGNPMGHSRPLPDPRFRTAIGLNELQNLVHLLAAKNGLNVRVIVVEDPVGNVPIAPVSGVALAARIEVNPQLARILPPNTWAFVLGHELSHLVDPKAQNGSGQGFRAVEWNADVIGAGYALNAGFDLAAHLGWVFSRPDQGSSEYGGDHERALNIARHFGADWNAVRACQSRYRHPAGGVWVALTDRGDRARGKIREKSGNPPASLLYLG